MGEAGAVWLRTEDSRDADGVSEAGEKRERAPASPEGGTALQSLRLGPDPRPASFRLWAQAASQGRLGASLSRGRSVISRSGPPRVFGVQPARSPLPALSLTGCASYPPSPFSSVKWVTTASTGDKGPSEATGCLLAGRPPLPRSHRYGGYSASLLDPTPHVTPTGAPP